jgi:flagellin-specific chaperone FliS
MAWDQLETLLKQLNQALLKNDEQAIKEILKLIVTGYVPQ